MTHHSYDRISFWSFAIKRLVWLPFAFVCIAAAFVGKFEFATRTLVTTVLLWALTKIIDDGVEAIKKIVERTSSKDG